MARPYSDYKAIVKVINLMKNKNNITIRTIAKEGIMFKNVMKLLGQLDLVTDF